MCSQNPSPCWNNGTTSQSCTLTLFISSPCCILPTSPLSDPLPTLIPTIPFPFSISCPVSFTPWQYFNEFNVRTNYSLSQLQGNVFSNTKWFCFSLCSLTLFLHLFTLLFFSASSSYPLSVFCVPPLVWTSPFLILFYCHILLELQLYSHFICLCPYPFILYFGLPILFTTFSHHSSFYSCLSLPLPLVLLRLPMLKLSSLSTPPFSLVLLNLSVPLSFSPSYDRSCSRHPPPLSRGVAPPLSLALARSLASEDSRQTLHSTSSSFTDRER